MRLKKKRINEAIHAKRRAFQRFGVVLNREDRKKIVEKIKRNDTTPVKRQSNRVTLHQIEYKGISMVVVYDKIRHQIITVLKPL